MASYDRANTSVDFELYEGSSGSWVVSEEIAFEPHDSGNHIATRVACIHGILVADDGYGDIYMIPLADIMDDIKHELDVSSVSLPPDTREIRRLLQLESFLLHDNDPSPELSTTAALDATSSLNTSPAESASVRTQNPSSDSATALPRDAVWYCSNCGDGPMGPWGEACDNCGHTYCSACTVEKYS